ncbi:FAD-binding domain-containing protein [Cryphonectria parasitica EP155]|uniref:FAD-binding domain-containing protein n=1 Tax=Cryphonectria parasitica (strain ATCC 38755 / EP155) TaxID=660469 RepID=A0A9P4XT79_CRYP1|nr:FAD-binding domain-containing protein [Cryphonectria parasitica EP155]KAF3760362.1 FAD-binding domain-containing protein [Cryphonectria parasitica EP155]
MRKLLLSSFSLGAAALTNSSVPSEIPVATLADGASCACTQLAAKYGASVIGQNSSDYAIETVSYWDIRSDQEPQCFFQPADASEVAGAVSTIVSCGAQFAIRGGGHMNFPGSNNINGGVVLALDNLTELAVAADNSSIAVGPGNRWVDVYSALDPYGLYCIGGRLKTIGVPGLSLIGGFHYLINTYGMVMDNILSYDVVLGNGTQVVANATSNPDLFWALKGGANNFGIVTKFVIKTLPIPYISTTVQTYNESAVVDFIGATAELAENDGPDLAAGSVISISYNATTKAVSPSLLGIQEGTESPPSRFANFSAIPAVSVSNNVLTPLQWHENLETPFQMFRIQFASHTMKANATQLNRIYDAWKAAVDEISDVEGLYPTFVMNILPKSAASVAKNNGIGNVWGLDDDESWIIWQFSTAWANEVDDLRMTNWVRSLSDYWHMENQALGLASEFLYMGDSGEFQDPFLGFPIENVQRMKAIREAYDPLGVFSRLNWGGFKLGAN